MQKGRKSERILVHAGGNRGKKKIQHKEKGKLLNQGKQNRKEKTGIRKQHTRRGGRRAEKENGKSLR